MRLGYERIVKDKRITIEVDDTEDSWVTLKIQGCSEVIRFKASGETDTALLEKIPAIQDEIDYIVDAVHLAYIQATTNQF